MDAAFWQEALLAHASERHLVDKATSVGPGGGCLLREATGPQWPSWRSGSSRPQSGSWWRPLQSLVSSVSVELQGEAERGWNQTTRKEEVRTAQTLHRSVVNPTAELQVHGERLWHVGSGRGGSSWHRRSSALPFGALPESSSEFTAVPSAGTRKDNQVTQHVPWAPRPRTHITRVSRWTHCRSVGPKAVALRMSSVL